MGAVTQPLDIDTARQQVETLSALYQMQKIFGNDPSAPNVLFRPEDQSALKWIASNPEARKLLDDYAKERAEAVQQQNEALHMWGDGSVSTKEERELYLARVNMTEGLNIATSNVLGSFGEFLGSTLYPGDPEKQNALASMYKNIGEMFVAEGESREAAENLHKTYTEWAATDHYAPGKPEEPEAPEREDIPPGSKSYNPYEREVERVEPEPPEPEPPEPDLSEHFDGGVPMGVSDDNPDDNPMDKALAQSPTVDPSPQPSLDGPLESAPEDREQQSVAPEPIASYPDDPVPFRAPDVSTSSTEPNASFPNDPIIDESRAPSIAPIDPEEPMSAPVSMPNYSPAPEPAPIQSVAPVFEPASIESTPPPVPSSIEPISSPPAIEPISSPPAIEPISSPPAIEPISSPPAYDPPG